DAGLLAVALERGQKVAQRRLSQPCGIEAAPRLRHVVSPGTKWPPSIWAGTEVAPGGEPPHCTSTRKPPALSTRAALNSQAKRGRLQEFGCSTPAWVAQRKTA